MARKLTVVALAVVVLGLGIWTAQSARGQGRYQATIGASARVGLVDLNHVFKNYEKYKRLSEQLKAELKQREREIEQLQTALKQTLNQRNQYKPDSANYRKLDEQLARTKAQLDLKVSGTRREFQQRDSQLVYQTYREVEDVIRRIAQTRGLTLVLQNTRVQNVDASNPQQVFRKINRQVVYSLPNMDITDAVLAELNRSAGAGRQLTRPTTQTPSYRTGQGPINRRIR